MTRPASNVRNVPWLAISVVLHTIVLVLLYLFTPLREIAIPDKKETMKPDTVSRERLREVQEQLTERFEQKLRQRVEDLMAIEESMEQIEKVRDEAYQQMADEKAANAIDAALKEMELALDFQEQATQQQTAQRNDLSSAVAEIGRFLAERDVLNPQVVPDLVRQEEGQ